MDEFTTSLAKHIYLFDHYMDHANRQMDSIAFYARKVGLPRLAAEHQGVLCSIMALGAACLCIDLLLDERRTENVFNVDDLIKIGEHYHQLGVQTVRHQMMLNQPNDITQAYAHSILLFPYAMAQQRISDLLGNIDSSESGTGLQLESMGHPNWAIVLRGISTCGRAYWALSSNGMEGVTNDATDSQPYKTHHTLASYILARVSKSDYGQETTEPGPGYCIASKHTLFPVVCSTRVVALEALQRRLDDLDQTVRNHDRKGKPTMNGDRVTIKLARVQSLTACSMAIDLLVGLGKVSSFSGGIALSETPCFKFSFVESISLIPLY